MQMNLIAQLTAAPSQPATSSDAPKESNDRFAKLLSDADAKGGHEQKQQSLTSNETSTAAIAAQEVDAEQPVAMAVPADNAKVLATTVGPQEAKGMLAKLEAMNQNGEHTGDRAFNQLKEALEDIANGGEPTDVAGMLEALPELVEAAPQERAPVLQRLMGWVSAAIEKHKESPANTLPDGTVQSLQASLFSAGDDAARLAAQAAAQAAADSKKKHAAEATAAVTVIVPTVQNAIMPEWVRKLGEGEENIATSAINDAIPPLALAQGDEGLPTVTLPGEEYIAAVKADKPAPGKDFEAMLHQVPANNNDPIETLDAPVVAADINTVAALSNAPSVQNTSTLNPITIAAHTHLATHTAASEQVHVAITTMKDEGLNSITMQLEPADLGRVEIRMDTVEGKTNIAFLVDKPETLDALARDARSLERLLQEAGVRADAGSMQFNLRQQAQEQASDDDSDGTKRNGASGDVDEISALPGAITKHYTLNVNDGVDIHA